MDRLSHLRGEAGGSRDSTLDTTSPPSESFMTANESSSKYFSLSEVDSVDSTFDISSIKDVSLASTTTDSEGTITNTDELISNLSPIGKKSDIMLDSYKIGKHIEAANILSGGVDIFDDNDNSYDGDELVIDDNVDVDDKSNSELNKADEEFKSDENMIESTLINEEDDIASKDTEVVLQIDGKNVDAIDIGNGLYLYRKEGQEELAAVQIIDDDQQQTSFKFLKVRENAEGNLEVYEEIEIEVPKEVPVREGKTADKKISSHVPIKNINKVISESACNKVAERKIKTPRIEPISTTSEVEFEINKEISPDLKFEVNLNGKMMKFSESRKSPVIGSFTPMTYHSTPNKEGIPLTKTMVDQQLHPNRHSDNIKKRIEVHTDSCKLRPTETQTKSKDADDNKNMEISSTEKEVLIDESIEKDNVTDETDQGTTEVENIDNDNDKQVLNNKSAGNTPNVLREQDNVIDSTEKDLNKDKTILKQDEQSAKVNKEQEEKTKDIINVEESMEVDNDIAETVPLKESADIAKVNASNVNEINKVDVKVFEPMQVNNEDGKEIDQSVHKNKATVNDNTQGDSQDDSKVAEIIYDISTDQENIEEIIIIDDSEIDETKIEEPDSESDKKDTKVENVNSNNEENSNIERNIATKNKDTKKLEESDQDNDKKDAKNVQADSTSSVATDTHKEQPKKLKIPSLSHFEKNSQTKIPIIKPEFFKVTLKPTGSETSATVEPSKLTNTEQVKKELKTESLEGKVLPKKNAKHIVLDKTPVQLNKTSDASQKISIKPENIQDKIIVIPEVVSKKTLTLSSAIIAKTETKKENKVLEKSPKKEPKKPIQVTESQLIVAPMEVDSSTNVKVKITDKVLVSDDKATSSVFEEEKPTTQETSQPTSELISHTHKKEKQETKIPQNTITEKVNSVKEVEVSKVPKDEPQPGCSGTQFVSSTSTDGPLNSESKNESEDNKDDDEAEPGGSKKAVPFGKWTATNRKEFLIKIKNRTTAPPATPSTSSNQLKNSNDLNRRDVLQKIDSQRQTSNALAKTQEANKLNAKNETAFLSKNSMINKDNNTQESKLSVKTDINEEMEAESSETLDDKATVKPDVTNNSENEQSQVAIETSVKKDTAKRTEVNYQDLIDKTIEGMIHRTVVPPKAAPEEPNQNLAKDSNVPQNVKYPPNYEPTDQATLDEIEMKMNELHGIPFIERPPHELPVVPITEPKLFSKADKEKQVAPIKTTKIPNLLPFTNKTQQKIIKESVIDVDSEEEIIEHEPITGDIDVNNKHAPAKLSPKENPSYTITDKSSIDASKKESIITEKDFDKFARRNSITYENRLTVSFDGKEPHNLFQSIVDKDPCPKSYSRNDMVRVDPKVKVPFKHQNVRPTTQPDKVQASKKFGTTTEDSCNRNQSKLQKAYQSALTAKRQLECPITIIEDKPVKVVFMDNMEFIPSQLNVQGQELSPAKKLTTEDNFTVSTLDSLESDMLDTTYDLKSQEEVKTKSKHQRKQVLTPVDEPELELIEPKDLGLIMSPKKKRKTDEDKTDKNAKYPMRKKYYLLGSNTAVEDKLTHTADMMKNPLKETVNRNDNDVAHKNAVSAIDSLVKAAELLEHQSENMHIIDSPTPDSQQSTPIKRGRGRPRKYPLPEGGVDKNKVQASPSPQKKPRLIDAKVQKPDTTTDDDDDSDDEIIKENWTMGKINENIVCPICNKLFRTENVVFKHVKHCTGPSPSRSSSDKRSPRRIRSSQESDSKSRESMQSEDMDIDDDKPLVVRKETPKKRKSKDSIAKSDDKDDVIVIEDAPVEQKPEKKEKEIDERKRHESRKSKAKILHKNNDLICEFCGKTFRQLSYLVNHKLQHKKDMPKKTEKDEPVANKSVYGCEVCKKEFRKLHHLVQHRIIHNPSSVPARSPRKSSSEHSDSKIEKEPNTSKQSEDPSAGFRCEPCDKSFRKLHHLVEHRETHDGINRQKTTIPVIQNNVEKPVTLHQCEVCKKTFRQLNHLIEHKEQHVETSSEKSDDKSVKSSLSTRDIIHECSLCYMVFPNEHSLNKHTIICQRKKRQSKQAKPTEESEAVELIEDANDNQKIEEKLDDVVSPKLEVDEVKDDEVKNTVVEKIELPKDIPEAPKEKPAEITKEVPKEKEIVPQKLETKPVEPPAVKAKSDFIETENGKTEAKPEIPEKMKKIVVKETTKVHETPKKKTVKEKSMASASKRLKTTTPVPVPVVDDVTPAVESSDDDEVRYMLNPNFKVEDTAKEKIFMKVGANKRNSLQIERPDSKDLDKRRTSLQHPPKIPRLKPRAIEHKPAAVKHVAKTPKIEPVPSTDSDDSETVKYSFPKTIPANPTKPAKDRTPKTIKTPNKSLADKRKSLSGIAKRKSLGRAVIARHKPSSPMKQIKRRTLEVEHRCDCGQLFNSAALLSRHTSLAHTPPRIRRRRSPPPDTSKPARAKPSVADKPKQTAATRKSSARSDSSTSTNTKPNKSETKTTRKSLDKEEKILADARKPKPEKPEAKSSVKPRRTGAHTGVPVPEKMRKLMDKNNK